MGDIADLIPDVRTNVASVSEPMTERYLRRAARRFLRDSRVWEVVLGSRELVEADIPDDGDEAEFVIPSADFVIPTGGYVNRITDVSHTPATGRAVIIPPERRRFDVVTRNLILSPDLGLSAGDTLKVSAILETDRASDFVPDFALQMHGEAIADFATAELLSMPSTAWSNPTLAGIFMRRYDQRVADATVLRGRAGTRRRIRVTPVPFV